MNKKEENNDSYNSIYNDDDKEEFKLYKGIMNQKIENKNIVLSNEISKNKKIINRLFKDRFGKNFIPIKLESLKAFEVFVRYYYFSPHSKFLDFFPKLRKQILNERKINYNALNKKINCGSLLYLSLSGSGAQSNKKVNEKYFKISKNLESSESKDIISSKFYNIKYQQKNEERIKKILSGKVLKNKELKNIELKNTINNKRFLTNKKNNIKGKQIKIYKGRNYSNDNFSQNIYTIKESKTYNNFYKNNNQFISEGNNLNSEENSDLPTLDKNKNTLNYTNEQIIAFTKTIKIELQI